MSIYLPSKQETDTKNSHFDAATRLGSVIGSGADFSRHVESATWAFILPLGVYCVRLERNS